MSGRKIWINFEAPPQWYIRYINPWKKCSDLMQFLKYLAELFLRPLRSKDDWGWILRQWPQNFVTFSESLAANLEKVRHDKWFQSSDLFDFDIFLFALLTSVSLWGTIKKTNKPEFWNFSRLAAKLDYNISRLQLQNSILIVLWPQ